jgi:hypothetical protein
MSYARTRPRGRVLVCFDSALLFTVNPVGIAVVCISALGPVVSPKVLSLTRLAMDYTGGLGPPGVLFRFVFPNSSFGEELTAANVETLVNERAFALYNKFRGAI